MTQKVFTLEEIKRKLEKYCVYQDRCHQDVENKLYEYRLIPEARDHILLHLLQHDFLNEERFAKSFTRGKFRIKKWGKERIIRELKSRNISTYLLRVALQEIDEEDYLQTFYTLLQKKMEAIKDLDTFKKKKKLYEFLKYRGYETNIIMQAINDL